jgi:2'-5' RNA ligase
MTYSQKYTLVSFVSPVPIGTEFDMADWPLHITLADVFAIDRTGTDVEAKLAVAVAELPPVSANADKEVVLGTVHVVLLDKNETLLALHHHLVDLLEANGVIFNTPEFTRDGYLPHCTIQKTGRLRSGDKVTIDTIALIDMFPGNDWQRRKVINLFELRGM